MKKLPAIALGLVLLGVVGFFLLPRLLNKSSVEQVEPKVWRVTLEGSRYFDTGIPIHDSSHLTISGQPNDKWISWVENPYSAQGHQMVLVCVRELGEISQGCMFVPKGFTDTLQIKNDSNGKITLTVADMTVPRTGRKQQ